MSTLPEKIDKQFDRGCVPRKPSRFIRGVTHQLRAVLRRAGCLARHASNSATGQSRARPTRNGWGKSGLSRAKLYRVCRATPRCAAASSLVRCPSNMPQRTPLQ